jgi:Cd2+/Zn2+-exporting ATPase
MKADDSCCKTENVKDAGESEAGEKHAGRRLAMAVDGMHCADCALNIERSIKHISGVLEAGVNYVTGTAVVYYDPYRVGPDKIRKAIERPGYAVRDSRIAQASSWLGRNRLRLTVAASGVCLALSWALRWLDPGSYAGPVSPAAALALGAVAIGGFPIFLNAVRTLLSLDANVNVLVSAAAISIGDYTEAGTVVFILVLGEVLEDFTVRKTKRAISALVKITPKTATLRRDGREIEVQADGVNVGDRVVVRPGERVPVDGHVVSGSGTVDESSVTGESMPVRVEPGSSVYSGTVSSSGYLEVEATKVSADSTVARIRRLVEEAQMEKAPVQRTMDRMARYFVPAVFIAAAVVYGLTGVPERAITVLIVACPCALVLGTPTAVVAALGRAARRGILIKGGAFLELMGKVNAVLFDKTGTVTEGTPKVVGIRSLDGHSEDELLEATASVEKMSQHPLAVAVVQEAERRGIRVKRARDLTVEEGMGIAATLADRQIHVGSARYMERVGTPVPTGMEAELEEEARRGRSSVLMSHNGSLCGIIWVWDPPRKEAAAAVECLKRTGVERLAMLTGDNRHSARRAAEMVGISEIHAEMLPHEKLEKVRGFKADGYCVCVVGDGVNDAPALASAHVGVAMGVKGTDVALETADVALMSDDLLRVPEAMALGKRALRIIAQNAIFAVGFNLAMVALAAWGVLDMIGGALAHQVSSLGVILNSMRLFVGGVKVKEMSRASEGRS